MMSGYSEEQSSPCPVASPERLRCNPAEAVYLDEWVKRNARKPGINGGYTLLEHILCESGNKYPKEVSPRDMFVAASVIQWLGTNCGKWFMRECEEKIPELSKAREVADKLCREGV